MQTQLNFAALCGTPWAAAVRHESRWKQWFIPICNSCYCIHIAI